MSSLCYYKIEILHLLKSLIVMLKKLLIVYAKIHTTITISIKFTSYHNNIFKKSHASFYIITCITWYMYILYLSESIFVIIM